MARVQVGYDPGAEALQTTASPNIQTIQARFDPRSSSAFQLAEALGKTEPILEKWREEQKREKLQNDLLQLPALQARFRQELNNGTVTATQVGTMRPDLSTVVRARVAEGIGAEHGKEQIQGLINEVAGNAELLQDNTKRAEFIAKRKSEIFGKLGGDDFYRAGFISSVDKELNQWENGWQRQTNQYQTAVQERDFSGKAAEALASPDPAAALETLDSSWGQSSSLNNIKRKELIVGTAIDQAVAGGNTAILDKVPEKYLNADLKAKIADTKQKIESWRMSQYRFAREYEKEQQAERVRTGKLEILKEFSEGGQINPFKYQNVPELFEYAQGMVNAPRVSEPDSAAASTQIRQTILNQSTVVGMDPKTTIDQIHRNPYINPKDKVKLIEEVPKLIEGTIAMQDPMVRSVLDTRIEARLKALEGSTNARIQTLISGRNLRGEVMKTFDMGIRQEFQSYYESNNRTWPTGRAKQEIIDRQTEKAEKLLESMTSVSAASQGAAPAASGANAPQQSRPGVRRYNPATQRLE